MKKIIIDGHGQELIGQSFHLKNNGPNRIKVFSYVNAQEKINQNFSNTIIRNMINGQPYSNFSEREDSSTSTGRILTDRYLYDINYDINGQLDWDNDYLFAGINPVQMRIGETGMLSFNDNNHNIIYLRVEEHSQFNTEIQDRPKVKLSSIIKKFVSLYPNQELEFYWLVCRE